MIFFYFFFRRKCGVSYDPNIQKKIQKPKYLTTKKTEKKKENIRWRLGRGTLITCAKFQGLTLRNVVDIGVWRIWGFMLEPACTQAGSILYVSTTDKECKRRAMYLFSGDRYKIKYRPSCFNNGIHHWSWHTDRQTHTRLDDSYRNCTHASSSS